MKALFKHLLDASVSEALDEDGDWIRTVTLLGELVFCAESGDTITVPIGFASDGASVPKAFWSKYPPFGQYLPAAVVHDLLCVQGKRGECKYSSAEAADIFKQAMRCCGVARFRAWKMWFAVRYFGPQWD